MSKTRLAHIGASVIGGVVLVGIPLMSASAASTIAQASHTIAQCPSGSTDLSSCARTSLIFLSVDIQVQYRGLITNANTGEIIPPGGSVPCGTKIILTCDKHVDDDISWFTPGSSSDSPYGNWLSGGASCTKHYDVIPPASGLMPGVHAANVYSSLSMPYPSQSIGGVLGLSSCTTLADGCSMTCIANTTDTSPTNIPISFNYNSVDAQFYGSTKSPPKCSPGSSDDSNIFDIPIPAASINYPITITPDGSGPSCSPTTPNTPPPTTPLTLTAGPGTAACTIGTPYAITMSASGAQGAQVRYLIDWNNDGVADEIVPPSGYLPLGTPQTATRTYVSEGSKTVAVMAQDDKGNTTAWTSFSFECSPGYTSGGNDTSNNNTDNTNDNTGIPIQTDLNLSVVPSLVGRGETTKINWSSTNMTSCTVTATNGDTWTDLQSPIGGEASSPITQQTTYTLTCMGLDGVSKQKQATVNIVPVFNEQ